MGGSACCHTRRAAVRLLAVCALAAPAALRSGAARAIRGWCRRDPIVKIGDVTAHIVLSSYAEMNELSDRRVPAGDYRTGGSSHEVRRQ